MAQKISQLPALAQPRTDDELALVDVHDTALPTGVTKRALVGSLPFDPAGAAAYAQAAAEAYAVALQPLPATVTAPGVTRQLVFNVLDYGAAGDGSHDDTSSIQAALNAAASGSRVWVPYTAAGYVCGALVIPPGVHFDFDRGAKLVAASTLAAPWIVAQQNVVHDGTAVTNGIFDATPVSSVRAVDCVLKFNGMTNSKNIRIEGNQTINAPVHGMRIGELTATYGMKYVRGNFINEHGLAPGGTGFGIYCDYVGNVLIEGNVCYTAGVAGVYGDNIELGHSGPRFIGLNTYLRCVDNVCIGGQINYPFSDYAEILDNTVVGPIGGIQNDGNLANNVQICNNRVYGAAPTDSQFAGISNWGTSPTITGNYVQVTVGNGIGGSWSANASVTGNTITSTSSTNSGYGIWPGGGGTGHVITGNIISGAFLYGIHMPFTFTVVQDNVITTYNGLDGSNCKNSVVTGNTVVPSGGAAMTTGLIGTGSVFRDNPGIPEYTAVTSAYNMGPADYFVEATAGTFIIALPGPSSYPGRPSRTIKNSGTGIITVQATGGSRIDGQNLTTIQPGGTLTVISDGTTYKIVSTWGSQLVFNVRDYGAAGDGVTDDAVRINSAVAACSAAGGGIVYIPPGSYYLSGPVVAATGVHVRGAGMRATTLLPSATVTGAGGDGIRLIGTAGAFYSRVTVSDLSIDFSNTPQYAAYRLGATMTPYSNGLSLQGIDDLRIENVHVNKPWGYGAFIGSLNNGSAPFVKRPRIRNLHVSGGRGGWDALGGGGISDGEVDGLYVYPATDGTNPYGTANDWTNTLNTTVKNLHAWTTFVQGPITAQVTPAVPPTGISLLNPFAFPVTVALATGTVTACSVNSTAQSTTGPWTLPGFGQISVSYTTAPTWTWTAPSAPAVAASGAAVTNPFAFPIAVTVTGGTVSEVDVNGTAQTATTGYFLVPLNGTITLTYTAAPTWAWASVTPTNPGAIMTDFGAVNVRYTGVHVNGFPNGIVITKQAGKPFPQEIKIDHCDFVNTGNQAMKTNVASGFGINGIEVTDCWIDKWGMAGSGDGIELDGTQGFQVANNRFGSPAASEYCVKLGTDGVKGCNYGTVQGNDMHNVIAARGIVTVTPGAVISVRANAGYNPAGALTVAVPATATATAAQLTDATFYVTAASTGTTTVAVSGGPVVTIPPSACVPVRVPGGQTLTPVYTAAPTWVVEGE